MKTKFIISLVSACACATALAQGAGGTLGKIAETKSITIGHRESAIPLSYYDDKQKPVGYAVDLCLAVADAVKRELKMPNLEVKFAAVNGSTRIPLIANGTIDLECGSTTNNVDRQKQVAFSVTTFIAANRFASKKADRLGDLNALKGKIVTSSAGSNNIEQIKTINATRKLDMTVLPAKDFAEGFLILETGRADAMVLDDIMLAGLIANSKDPEKFTVSSQALSAEPYGLMMRRDDPAFKKVVDDTLKQLYTSGAAAKLYQKWFQSPIPPRGINMSLPVSKALQKVWQSPIDSADPAAYLSE
jgi:glutamate/aspartate transport system substrate-binding protein